MRVLVTGAAGSIGRCVCRNLLMRHHDVGALVRSHDSARRLPQGVAVRWVGAIEPATVWPSELFDDVDAVIHLAAKVHADRAEVAAEPFQHTNVAATETLARSVAAGKNKPRLVYCSSAHAVCNFSAGAIDEESECHPQTPYGRSKHDAELMIRRLAAELGLRFAILRPAPVYGPDLPGDLMRLLRIAAHGWPLPLAGVDNRRSLVFVENIADALAVAATHPAAEGETFFVSDGDDVSLAALLRRFSGAIGRPSRLFNIAPGLLKAALRLVGRGAAAERMLGSLAIDGSRIGRKLAWRPPYQLDEGLAVTAQWMKRAA